MSKKKRIRKRIKNWLIYVVVKSGLMWINNVQRSTAMKFLENMARLGYYLVRSERNKTIRHLTQVYGVVKTPLEIKQMARDVFANLGRNMADAFRLARYNSGNIDLITKANGLHILDAALKKGRGVIALTGHIGNWELMGAFLAMKGYRVNVVGATIYDPRLDALVVGNRQNSGLNYIERGAATREILRALRRNEIVGLLIDQDTTRVDGVFVDFMGRKAYTPVGPVMLAMKTKAVIVPMAVHVNEKGQHVIEIRDEIALEISGNMEQDRILNTQRCSDALEQFIREHPTQWVWMHERWKTRPPEE
ncbi:MAG: lysophospholipid acyltransferase family protein [Candidatus Zhuqueibacterota bacterium]